MMTHSNCPLTYEPQQQDFSKGDLMKRIFFALALSVAAMPVFAQDTITTVAGNGNTVYSGDGGPATSAGIFWPQHITMIPGGGYYVSAYAQLRKVDANGTIHTIAGNGTPGYSGDGGPAAAASIAYMPVSMRLAPDGSLYFADSANFRVRKIGTDGIIRTVAGNGTFNAGADGIPATSSPVKYPMGIELDAAGNLYISEASSCRIRKVDTHGIITTIAGNGICATSGDGGSALAASLHVPWGLRLDSVGNLYISESNGSNRIRKVDTSGTITTVPGSVGIVEPMGMDFDATGNLYVAAYGEHRVYRISPGGGTSVIAGSGTQGFSGDGGSATSARLSNPRSVTVGSGVLYIADGQNNRVRMMLADVAPQESAGTPSATTCASEGYTGTKLQWCINICESNLTGRQLDTWIKRWSDRYHNVPYCAVE